MSLKDLLTAGAADMVEELGSTLVLSRAGVGVYWTGRGVWVQTASDWEAAAGGAVPSVSGRASVLRSELPTPVRAGDRLRVEGWPQPLIVTSVLGSPFDIVWYLEAVSAD